MKAVFFPFTFMTEALLDACCRFFNEIVVVQATGDNIPGQMVEWQAEGRLDIHSPGPDTGNITAMLQNYRTWPANHQGTDISVYKVEPHHIPFFDDTSIAQIKKDIRTAGTGDETDPDSAESDRLLQARLFLQMAQGFDEQSLDIARNLRDQAEKERGLFDGLRGENALPPVSSQSEPSSISADPFTYMLTDRLSAWTRVMVSCGLIDNMFITNSRESLELAMDDLQNTDVAIHIQRIPCFEGNTEEIKERKAAFRSYIINLSRTSPSQFQEDSIPQFSVENGDEHLAVELVTIPGIPPADFFPRFLKGGARAPMRISNEMSIKNTVLGLIELPA